MGTKALEHLVESQEADRLVRQGSSFTMVGPQPSFGIKLLTVKSALKDEVTKVHTAEWKFKPMWESRNYCRRSFTFIVRWQLKFYFCCPFYSPLTGRQSKCCIGFEAKEKTGTHGGVLSL